MADLNLNVFPPAPTPLRSWSAYGGSLRRQWHGERGGTHTSLEIDLGLWLGMLSQGTQWLSRRGYRLSEKITVNDGDGTNRDLGHEPGHDPDDPVQSVDEDTFNARQKWILEQLESVEGIRIGDVTAAFGSSNSTAKRDITELREEGMIVFEGKSRTVFIGRCE